MIDFAARGYSKRTRGRWGSILYSPLSGRACRPELSSVYKGPDQYIPEHSKKDLLVPKEAVKSHYGGRSQISFSVGSCTFFSFNHLSSLHSYSWCNTSNGISLWGEVNKELPGPCLGTCPWSLFLAGAFACKNQAKNASSLLSEKVLLQVMIAQDGKVMSERCFEHCQSEVKPGIWWMAVSSRLHYIHSVFRNAYSTYIVFKLKKLQNIFNFRVLFSWQNFPDCFLLRKNFHQIEYIASNVRSLKEQVCSWNQLRNFQMHCLVETSWAHRAQGKMATDRSAGKKLVLDFCSYCYVLWPQWCFYSTNK